MNSTKKKKYKIQSSLFDFLPSPFSSQKNQKILLALIEGVFYEFQKNNDLVSAEKFFKVLGKRNELFITASSPGLSAFA